MVSRGREERRIEQQGEIKRHKVQVARRHASHRQSGQVAAPFCGLQRRQQGRLRTTSYAAGSALTAAGTNATQRSSIRDPAPTTCSTTDPTCCTRTLAVAPSSEKLGRKKL